MIYGMASNGSLSPTELAPIPGGQLAVEAAGGWNASGGPADHGLRPGGPNSSYRLKSPASRYGTQEWFWLHQPPLAAYPGTSNHGWGKAIDLEATWMRGWIDDHGSAFGWRKTEAFSEWWHVNYVLEGHHWAPPFEPLSKGDRGKRVRFYTKRLAFIHEPGGRAYLKRPKGRPGRVFKKDVKQAVEDFQQDHGLKGDGVIGPRTGRKIGEVFHKQYVKRKNKHHRTLRVAAREQAALLRRGRLTFPKQHPAGPLNSAGKR
jgi:peptidoglycan hydrolase-like protein with peptidoglycan-binding domain